LSKIAPARVESDVRAAALAESIFGAGKGRRIFIYVTVGTGISYCLMLDGLPFQGAQGNAITFASAPLTTTCEHCGSEMRPVLEEFASGPAIAQRYARSRSSNIKHANVSCTDVFQLAKGRDRNAQRILKSAGHALGVNVAFLVNVLDPELVVVGGGLGVAGGTYWTTFVRACRAHIYAETARDIPIVRARLGIDAGVVGAAASVFKMKTKQRRGSQPS
jgi:glucokinase